MKTVNSLIALSVLGFLAACSKEAPDAAAAGKEGAEDTPVAGAPVSANISAETAKRVGIGVETAGPQKIVTAISLYGSVRPNAEREQEVRARFGGVVRTVSRRTGDSVKDGEVLFTVESSESLQVYSVRAPLSGQVLARTVNPGDSVDSSTVLMKVADLSTVWVEFAVFARDLGGVKAGMPVVFRSPDAQEEGNAKLSYVAPSGRADSQSVIARAVVDNRKGQWIAGQFVTGQIITGDAEVPVAVRPSALQELNDKTVVFVQTDTGFVPHEVRVGRRSAEFVEILSGVDAGAAYATKNSYLIKSDLLKGEAEED